MSPRAPNRPAGNGNRDAARRIEALAQESKSLVQSLADAVNKREEGDLDRQPHHLNELATRAVFCADEIVRLARALALAEGQRDEGGPPRRPADTAGGVNCRLPTVQARNEEARDAMAIAEIKVIPVGTGSASFSSIVTECYRVAQETPGIRHQLTPTSTIVEGDLPQVLDVVRRMHDATFGQGCRRVITSVAIDDRRDRPSDMHRLVESVRQELRERP